MEIKIGGNKKCEVCKNEVENLDTGCWVCRSVEEINEEDWIRRRKEVHEDTVKFISDLQKAQEATRKHNTHFGPGPNGSYDCNINKPTKIKTIRTTPEQMEQVIKNANTVVSNTPPWRVINKPTYEELETICDTIIKASEIHLKTKHRYVLADTCEYTDKIVHLSYCFDCENISLFYNEQINGNDELRCNKCFSDYIITIEELNAYKPMSERTEDEEDLAIYGNLDNIFDVCEGYDYSRFNDIKIKINQVYEYTKTFINKET